MASQRRARRAGCPVRLGFCLLGQSCSLTLHPGGRGHLPTSRLWASLPAPQRWRRHQARPVGLNSGQVVPAPRPAGSREMASWVRAGGPGRSEPGATSFCLFELNIDQIKKNAYTI